MQHLHPGAQVAIKQRVLEDNLWHLAKVRPEQVLRPIEGPAWGYRYRARLSVRHVRKKGTVLVGFHERKSRYVADMRECHVLPPHVSDLLLPLRELIGSMDARDDLPADRAGRAATTVTALVLRHLEPLSEADLRAAARVRRARTACSGGCSPRARTPCTCWTRAGPELAYTLPEFGITMPFRPTDFTQVNPHINRRAGVDARCACWTCRPTSA